MTIAIITLLVLAAFCGWEAHTLTRHPRGSLSFMVPATAAVCLFLAALILTGIKVFW